MNALTGKMILDFLNTLSEEDLNRKTYTEGECDFIQYINYKIGLTELQFKDRTEKVILIS